MHKEADGEGGEGHGAPVVAYAYVCGARAPDDRVGASEDGGVTGLEVGRAQPPTCSAATGGQGWAGWGGRGGVGGGRVSRGGRGRGGRGGRWGS